MHALISTFLMLVLASAFAFSGNSATAQNQAPPVTVAKPVVKTIVEDDEFVGRFEAKSEVIVRSRVTGYLEEVHFDEGTLVSEDQVLFTIDQRQFRTILRQAEARIDVAEATYEFAEDQLERAESLITNGNISQSVLDSRREAFLAAQGALEEARASLELAELDLEYSQITAPISGRIDRPEYPKLEDFDTKPLHTRIRFFEDQTPHCVQ